MTVALLVRTLPEKKFTVPSLEVSPTTGSKSLPKIHHFLHGHFWGANINVPVELTVYTVVICLKRPNKLTLIDNISITRLTDACENYRLHVMCSNLTPPVLFNYQTTSINENQ